MRGLNPKYASDNLSDIDLLPTDSFFCKSGKRAGYLPDTELLSATISNSSNPRQAACSVLLRILNENSFADHLMDRELSDGRLNGPDRGLFAELVFGVLRRQGTLDHVLNGLVTQPLLKLEPQVLIFLRLGLYQLMYLDRIPESAAVNESVKLAKHVLPRAAGFVNAVLRNYIRHKSTITWPDPVAAPAASIAARHSHPLWLVKLWFSQLGEKETELLAEASSCQPQLILRANTLKITQDALLQLFATNGITAFPCRFSPHGLTIEGRHNISGLPGFRDGLFAVQDESSQMASIFLDPQPGERVLDACAAPGGKCTHLAQLMDNKGELLATDNAASKLSLIQETAARLGISIIRTRATDLLRSGQFSGDAFDRILLDAPCSGLGVIRRNPEAKWRLSLEDIDRLAVVQKYMLATVAGLLKPGGTLLYSTCSTSRKENEDVIEDFLSHHKGFVLENLTNLYPRLAELFTSDGMYRVWPHRQGMDGFFAARIRRKEHRNC